jgi:DNA-binding response OmpR family regulator
MNSVPPGPRRPTVLVIDDSEVACEAVKHALRGEAVDVLALNSPFGFIKAIRESELCLLLVDVGLGSMNGAKLVHLGRQHVPAGCPILLYSSRETDLLEQDVAESGADGFIPKTLTGQAFVDAIRRWLYRRPSRRPPG